MIELKKITPTELTEFMFYFVANRADEYDKYYSKRFNLGMDNAILALELASIEMKNEKENYFYHIVNNKKNVGYIWAAEYLYYGKNNVLYIHDFIIKEEFRKKGIGERAVRNLKRVAKEEGYKKLMLHAHFGNKPSYKFCNKNGFGIVSSFMAAEV